MNIAKLIIIIVKTVENIVNFIFLYKPAATQAIETQVILHSKLNSYDWEG